MVVVSETVRGKLKWMGRPMSSIGRLYAQMDTAGHSRYSNDHKIQVICMYIPIKTMKVQSKLRTGFT